MSHRLVAAATAAIVFAGCSSIEGEKRNRLLIPARTLNVSQSLTIPAETLAAAGLIFLIVDPLAPNWSVEVESIGQRRYRIVAIMKRFITGGEGEAGAVVKRTAEKLRHEAGFAEYALLELSEGIESRVPIAQRVAHALVELR